MNTQEIKKYLLEDMRELAYRAYRGISFSPEKRAESVVKDYSEELENDLKTMPEVQKDRYIQNYRKYLSAWLSAKGRCLSSMITGPANFPTRRNEKANRSEENRGKEFFAWRERALEAIKKQELANRSPQEVVNDEWKQVQRNIGSSLGTIIGIDNGDEGCRGYARPLFVSSVTNTIKTLAKNGKTELVKLALNYIRGINKQTIENGGKEVITSRNGIWELEQVAEVAREQEVDNSNRENESETFGDIEIVKNYQMDRVQIVFPSKPNEATRGKLKKLAFKWSPTQGVWQRQLTRNGIEAAKEVVLAIVAEGAVKEPKETVTG